MRGPGIPDSVAVPSLLFTKVTPAGRLPVRVIAMLGPVGYPVVVTVKVPGEPSVKVVWSALVIVGPSRTVKVNDWVASGAMPLLALIEIV